MITPFHNRAITSIIPGLAHFKAWIAQIKYINACHYLIVELRSFTWYDLNLSSLILFSNIFIKGKKTIQYKTVLPHIHKIMSIYSWKIIHICSCLMAYHLPCAKPLPKTMVIIQTLKPSEEISLKDWSNRSYKFPMLLLKQSAMSGHACSGVNYVNSSRTGDHANERNYHRFRPQWILTSFLPVNI